MFSLLKVLRHRHKQADEACSAAHGIPSPSPVSHYPALAMCNVVRQLYVLNHSQRKES